MTLASPIAVIMSVYKNDRLSWLKSSCESILSQRSIRPMLFVAVDGPVDVTIRDYLIALDLKENAQVLFFEKNLGLALRLNQLIDHVLLNPEFEYIARMDSDDISYPDRLCAQINFLEHNPSIGVLGCSVREIREDSSAIGIKSMERNHDVLAAQIIKRCPFNHPTVVFRRYIFEDLNQRYNASLKNTQDYYLWVNLLEKGVRFANLDEILFDFRIDEGFYSRRGLSKAKNDFKSRIYAMRKLKLFSLTNLFFSIGLFALRVSPKLVKKWAYRSLR